MKSLVKEDYPGIRPALGYPACPDHSEKETLWKILEVIPASMTHPPSRCFAPASLDSIGHPDARYFNVGTITEEQLNDTSSAVANKPRR